MISALTDKGRVTLMNRDAKIWQANEASPVKVADRPALRAFLVKYFGFDFPCALWFT
jgi:N-hydroxyarylamine O-acetyltransferase